MFLVSTGKLEWLATYDDKAIYFIILMFDDSPNEILKQLSQRDNLYSANARHILGHLTLALALLIHKLLI